MGFPRPRFYCEPAGKWKIFFSEIARNGFSLGAIETWKSETISFCDFVNAQFSPNA